MKTEEMSPEEYVAFLVKQLREMLLVVKTDIKVPLGAWALLDEVEDLVGWTSTIKAQAEALRRAINEANE